MVWDRGPPGRVQRAGERLRTHPALPNVARYGVFLSTLSDTRRYVSGWSPYWLRTANCKPAGRENPEG
jgi:hypothetical protein